MLDVFSMPFITAKGICSILLKHIIIAFNLKNSTSNCFTFQKGTICASYCGFGFVFEIDEDMNIC